MNKQLIINDLLKKELKRCTKLLNKMDSDFAFLPKGSLRMTDNRYYLTSKHDGQFIHIRINEYSPDGRDLIDALRYKRFIKAARPILRKKIKAIRTVLKTNPLYDPLQIKARLCPQYHDIDNLPIFLDGDINIDSLDTCIPPPMYTDTLKHSSKYGLKTRSKTEAMIATALDDEEMIFQYESVLKLRHRTVRPDFRILLPHKRKYVYWEHFGKLDDPGYVFTNLIKLQDYAASGITLGDNLVLTFETADCPLTYDTIMHTIQIIRNM